MRLWKKLGEETAVFQKESYIYIYTQLSPYDECSRFHMAIMFGSFSGETKSCGLHLSRLLCREKLCINPSGHQERCYPACAQTEELSPVSLNESSKQ